MGEVVLHYYRNIQFFTRVLYTYTFYMSNFIYLCLLSGRAVALWLRHCATNRQVAGSIPDGVIGIFH